MIIIPAMMIQPFIENSIIQTVEHKYVWCI
jgi:sensor histidine kinase YesM